VPEDEILVIPPVGVVTIAAVGSGIQGEFAL